MFSSAEMWNMVSGMGVMEVRALKRGLLIYYYLCASTIVLSLLLLRCRRRFIPPLSSRAADFDAADGTSITGIPGIVSIGRSISFNDYEKRTHSSHSLRDLNDLSDNECDTAAVGDEVLGSMDEPLGSADDFYTRGECLALQKNY